MTSSAKMAAKQAKFTAEEVAELFADSGSENDPFVGDSGASDGEFGGPDRDIENESDNVNVQDGVDVLHYDYGPDLFQIHSEIEDERPSDIEVAARGRGAVSPVSHPSLVSQPRQRQSPGRPDCFDCNAFDVHGCESESAGPIPGPSGVTAAVAARGRGPVPRPPIPFFDSDAATVLGSDLDQDMPSESGHSESGGPLPGPSGVTAAVAARGRVGP
jgi:hypothetical protein